MIVEYFIEEKNFNQPEIDAELDRRNLSCVFSKKIICFLAGDTQKKFFAKISMKIKIKNFAEVLKMTKKEIILWANFIAAFDVKETPMAGFENELDDLDEDEVAEIFDCSVMTIHDGKKVCIIPDKSNGWNFKTFTFDEHLVECEWKPTDEELVEILKEQEFFAPWVSKQEVSRIVLDKWSDVIKNF